MVGHFSGGSVHNLLNFKWLKGYGMVQLVFGHDMTLPIKHKVDWKLMSQKKQMQINKDNVRKNNKGVDYEYKVRDKVVLDKYAAYKYGTPYKGPFMIMQCWTNGIVTLKISYNILRIKPHTSDINIENVNLKNNN